MNGKESLNGRVRPYLVELLMHPVEEECEEFMRVVLSEALEGGMVLPNDSLQLFRGNAPVTLMELLDCHAHFLRHLTPCLPSATSQTPTTQIEINRNLRHNSTRSSQIKEISRLIRLTACPPKSRKRQGHACVRGIGRWNSCSKCSPSSWVPFDESVVSV